MAEFIAVLDRHERRIVNDLDQVVNITDSTVVGLRVNDGPTVTSNSKNTRPVGKTYERMWRMPDDLAFATEAFYRAVYCEQSVPQGHIYDCHSYLDYVLRYLPSMTRPEGEDASGMVRSKLAVFPSEMKPWVGYTLFRTKGLDAPGDIAGVHSFLALPRRYGILLESLSVAGIYGPMVVARPNSFRRIYGGQKFHQIFGLVDKNGQQ